MKKSMLLAVILMLSITASFAQKGFRLNAYSFYVFDDRVDSYYDPGNYYDGKIKGGYLWGVGGEFMVRPDMGVELTYLHENTKAPTNYLQSGYLRPKFTEFDLAMNYILLGGNHYFHTGAGRVEPYAGAMLGVGIFNINNPDNGNSSSNTKFTWGVKGGLNINASEKVAVKLQTMIISATQAVGGGFYFGTGGVGTGLSSYSTMYQFSLGGGLTFKFGGAAPASKTYTVPK